MKKFIITFCLIIVTTVAYYLGSPLFYDKTVDEEFPIKTIENLTAEEVDAMPQKQQEKLKKQMDEIHKTMEDKEVTETMPDSEPKLLFSGNFTDVDSFHKGSGKAGIYELPDNAKILRFEDFQVTNGPALSVWLVKSANGNPDSGYLDLGKLKGNIGNQNYDIPADTDLSEYKSVIIRCVPFRQTFSVAELG